MVTSLEASKPRTSDGKPRHHTQQQRHSLQKETAANLAAIFRLRYIPQPTIHKCECSMDTSASAALCLEGTSLYRVRNEVRSKVVLNIFVAVLQAAGLIHTTAAVQPGKLKIAAGTSGKT